MKRIYFNEDNEHFYDKPVSEMTHEGLRKLVAKYADSGNVKGILFCTNVQTALFESNVWQKFRDLADEAGPAKKGLTALAERGINHFQVWLDECRKKDVEGWLTMRMNDCHGLEETAAGDFRIPMSHWASDFWRANPSLRRAPYRRERAWEGAFDYGHEVVREHHLALVKELFERFDMDGLELDWMRWVTMFKPGFERKERQLLTDFVCKVRDLADTAEKRWGHPIRLAHRVVSDPSRCFDFGFDVAEWGAQGAVDMLTLGFFGMSTGMDHPLELWRRLLPASTHINTQAAASAKAFPGCGASGYEFMFASADAAFTRGADGVYLFNVCYLEGPNDPVLADVLDTLGSPEKLAEKVRRYTVDYPDTYVAGSAVPATLPQKLMFEEQTFARFRENITIRIPCGTPAAGEHRVLRLGFSGVTDASLLNEMPVRFNTHLLQSTTQPEFSVLPGWSITPAPGLPKKVEHVLCYAIPQDICHADFNAIEMLPPQIEGQLIWAEIIALPEKG